MTIKTKFTGLVLDTETHFKSEHQNLIYDIGWVMGDLRTPSAPKIERRFFIKEFLPINYWKHSYMDKKSGIRKFWKLDSRAERTQVEAFENPSMVKSWDFVMGVLCADVSMVDSVGSYNWGFDSRAIDTTNLKLNHAKILPTWEMSVFCLLDMYVRKIINKTYFAFIDSLDEIELENYKSKSGKNLGYSAEIMARYMNEFSEYKEAHTALDDSRIEFQLARDFVSRYFTEFKNDFLNNVQGVSWTEVRNRTSSAEKMRKREARTELLSESPPHPIVEHPAIVPTMSASDLLQEIKKLSELKNPPTPALGRATLEEIIDIQHTLNLDLDGKLADLPDDVDNPKPEADE